MFSSLTLYTQTRFGGGGRGAIQTTKRNICSLFVHSTLLASLQYLTVIILLSVSSSTRFYSKHVKYSKPELLQQQCVAQKRITFIVYIAYTRTWCKFGGTRYFTLFELIRYRQLLLLFSDKDTSVIQLLL